MWQTINQGYNYIKNKEKWIHAINVQTNKYVFNIILFKDVLILKMYSCEDITCQLNSELRHHTAWKLMPVNRQVFHKGRCWMQMRVKDVYAMFDSCLGAASKWVWKSFCELSRPEGFKLAEWDWIALCSLDHWVCNFTCFWSHQSSLCYSTA